MEHHHYQNIYLNQQQQSQQPQHQPGCNLIGIQGIIVQMMLAVVAFCILIVKRALEHPPRHIKVWFFDTFKQIISQLTTHSLNVIFSMIMTVKQQEIMAKSNDKAAGPDECNFYLVTILIDTSVCVFIACYTLQFIENRFLQKKYNLRQGNFYAQQDLKVEGVNITIIEILLKNWFSQLGIWLAIVFSVKLSMFGIQFLFEQQLGELSFIVLYFLNPYPLYKLILVMMIVPTFMNMLLFWVQDNFLQQKKTEENQLQISQEMAKQNFEEKDTKIQQKQKVFEKITQENDKKITQNSKNSKDNIVINVNKDENQSNYSKNNNNDDDIKNNSIINHSQQELKESVGQLTELEARSQKGSFVNHSQSQQSINNQSQQQNKVVSYK